MTGDLLSCADRLLESLACGAHLVSTDLDVLSGAGVHELDVVHRPALLLLHGGAVGVGDLVALDLLLRSTVLHYDGVTHVLTLWLVEAVLAVGVGPLQPADLLPALGGQGQASARQDQDQHRLQGRD